MVAPQIFRYIDYRQYLASFFEFMQEKTKGQLRPYTYSDFSAGADIKSPNYLKLIIEGKRNLSSDMIKKFARALRLSKSETKEFGLLVAYNQEKDPLLRNHHLKALSEYRAKRAMADGQLDAESYNQVSNWLVWVLYAMIDQQGVRFEPHSLRQALGGRVNENQISAALKKMENSGQIKIDQLSKFAMKTNKMLQEAEKIPAELVRKIQSELIYLGLESLYSCGPKEREISGVTLAMTEKEYEWARFELRKLRKQIQKQVSTHREDGLGERVYQLNVQFFPLTEKADVSQGFRQKKSLEDPDIA